MVLTLLDEMLVKDLPTSSLTYGRLSCVLKTGTEVVKRPDRMLADDLVSFQALTVMGHVFLIFVHLVS